MAHQGPLRGVSDKDRTAVQAVCPLQPAEDAARSAALIVISGRSIGEMFVLEGRETSVGRAPECTIRLDDQGVSRHHAKILRRDGELILMDLGSTNGTFCEGERIDVVTLRDGMKVQVGSATILQFRFQDEREMQFHILMQNFKTHDPMTGALNRRAFFEEVEKEINFAHRHDHPLSLVMFDLDHFKRVNDTYGHQAGDMVIREVVDAVSEIMRREDVLARYGGEEFALLLRATALEPAFIVAERMRRAVEVAQILHEGRRIPATVSVGVASLQPDMVADGLVAAADEQLYRAKRRGRNRTESSLFD